VCDNGPEFRSRALDEWAYENGVSLDFIQPGKPVQNPFVESFNGKMRDECLNVHWFANVEEARLLVEDWRKDYTQVRPHSSLGNRTPSEFAAAFSIQIGLQELAS
jgi:putative transposase